MDPDSIGLFASSTFSQNGEDGIIEEIVRRLGLQKLTFVELGSSDGQENCTRLLLENGSVGLWVEGDNEKAIRAREVSSPSSLEVINVMIDRKNIMNVINCSALVNTGFDLLVVDLDGNDWWLLKEILAQYSPKVIVAEYNPAHGPKKKWVMPYDALHTWKGDQNYGASLSAYNELLSGNGYQLIACDPSGVNAFWVEAEEAHRFGAFRKAEELFAQAPIRRMHPKAGVQVLERRLNSEDLSRIKVIKTERLTRKESITCIVVCEVSNQLDVAISSAGSAPVCVGLRNSDSEEPFRAHIHGQIAPGKKGVAFAQLEHSESFSEIGVVQEGVGWSKKWQTV